MFLLQGQLPAASLATLTKAGAAAALRQGFDAVLQGLGGSLADFFFVAGDTRFLALVDMPRPAVGRLIFSLVGDGLVAEGTIRLNRVTDDFPAIDRELADAAALGMPFVPRDVIG